MHSFDWTALRIATELFEAQKKVIPVDLESLCSTLNVYLIWAEMRYKRDACYYRVDDQDCIGVNTRILNPGRVRFSIAHEIGHVAIAREACVDVGHISMASMRSFREHVDNAADTVATCLLMPLTDFMCMWREYGHVDPVIRPVILAQHYDVSLSAVLKRVADLGLDRPQRLIPP